MLCQNHPFFISLIPSRLSERPSPWVHERGFSHSVTLARFTSPYHLQVYPYFNRKTSQTPGDARAHSSPATASKRQIFVPLKPFEMQVRPRNAPYVNFIYIFKVCGYYTLQQLLQIN